jgi:hypothetical protein
LPLIFRPFDTGMKKYFIDAFWIICVSFFVWGSFVAVNNTLEHNAKWDSAKTSLGKGVMGAFSFYQGTQTLVGNTLHLNTWYGFQEVTTKENYSVPD